MLVEDMTVQLEMVYLKGGTLEFGIIGHRRFHILMIEHCTCICRVQILMVERCTYICRVQFLMVERCTYRCRVQILMIGRCTYRCRVQMRKIESWRVQI